MNGETRPNPNVVYHGFESTGFCEWDRSFEAEPLQVRPRGFRVHSEIAEAICDGDWMLGPYPVGRFEVMRTRDDGARDLRFLRYVTGAEARAALVAAGGPDFLDGFPADLRGCHQNRAQ